LVVKMKDDRWLFWTTRHKEILAESSKQGAAIADERRLRWSSASMGV